jgi:hypothetical protein
MDDKIVILELGLDEEIRQEIMEPLEVSDEIRVKIRSQLEGMKRQRSNKEALRRQKWEGTLDILFNMLEEAYATDPQSFVAKSSIIKTLECTDKEFSPIMQRFKKYLRTTKEDKWTIAKKRIKGTVNYALVPFS